MAGRQTAVRTESAAASDGRRSTHTRRLARACSRALTGHLQVDAAGHAAHLVMHVEEGLHLRGRRNCRWVPGQSALQRGAAAWRATARARLRPSQQGRPAAPALLPLPTHLGADVVVAPRLVAVDLLGVAVHGVAHPGHHLAGLLHRLDQRRQLFPQLHGAHAHDDGQAAGRVLGVERGDEGHQLRGVHLVADLRGGRGGSTGGGRVKEGQPL